VFPRLRSWIFAQKPSVDEIKRPHSHQQIMPSLEEIKEALKIEKVAHFDETGMRVLGKLHWVHVASTLGLTYYDVHERRGQIGMRDIGILPEFTGRAIHDHFKSYLQFKNCLHFRFR